MSSSVTAALQPDHPITIDWVDFANRLVNETLLTVNVGETVAFSGVNGRQVMVKFLSPAGGEALTLSNGQISQFTTGGIYQFQCFIDNEQAVNGGGIEIIPHRP